MEESSPAVSRSGSLPPGIGTPEESRPPPSPLSGAYLLVIISEPQTDAHKAIILQKLAKAFLSWDTEASGIDIERELAIVTALCPEGDFAKNGERLIQNASEHLVTEILVHPQVNTMRQCIRNLLSSFTKYRFIIHSGYAYCGNGSWILQDGTFSTCDFIDTFQEIEVQRVIRAYEKTVKIDICCISEGTWNQNRINQEPFTKICRVEINPTDKISPGNVAVREFVDYLERFVTPTSIQELLEPSDIVGNIRFTHPTLYVFPGGEGDAALFGINGFNMLVDGGFSRKACFWNFVRHLDRLDGVLLTRVNNSNMGGMSGIVQRKVCSHVYPQIGHFFSNLQTKRNLPSPDGDKDKEPLLVNLIDEGHKMVLNLKKLGLKPHHCYRDPNSEPINLYHKVGHGKLDMYVISPAKDSREVKEFLSRWNNYDLKLFSSTSKSGMRELRVPLQNLVSICALLVWQPANPEDHVTRILFPGSAPQDKIFEGFEKMKQLEFLKNSICTMKSITPVSMTVLKKQKISSEIITDSLHKGDGKNILGENEVDAIHKPGIELKKPKPRKLIEKAMPKEKSEIKTAVPKVVEKISDNSDVTVAKMEEKKKVEVKKIGPKPISERKLKPPVSLGATDRKSESEKSSPTTPKRTGTYSKVNSEITKDVTTKPTQEGLKSHITKPAIETKPITDKDHSIKSTLHPLREPMPTKEQISTKEPTSVKEPIIIKDQTLVKEQISKVSTEATKTSTRSANRIQIPPKVFNAAKSLKDENNRKVAEAKKESRTRTPPKITPISKPTAPKKDEDANALKTEKKPMPIKRPRLPPKVPSTQSSAPVAVKKVIPTKPLKVDESKKNLKKDIEKTDSSAVSTPSTIDADVVHNITQGAELLEIKKVGKETVEALAPTDDELRQDTNVTTYVSKMYRKEGHGVDDDEDEILVIETTEMKEISSEEQKYLRDEKESEKRKEQEKEIDKDEEAKHVKKPLKIDTEKNLLIQKSPIETKTQDSALHKDLLTPEEKDKISGEVEGIITAATKLVSLKDSDTKSTEDDQRRLEVEKDEKIAFESASTTTAPTMPEDEKVDDIKQEIEEKYDKEETKERSTETKPESELLNKNQKIEETRKTVSKKDVKTPDEVADLPVDDEIEANLQQEERDKLHDLPDQPTIMQPVTDIVELKHAEYVTITPTPLSSPDEKTSPLQEPPDKDLKEKSSLNSPKSDQLPMEDASEIKQDVQLKISETPEDQKLIEEITTKVSEPLVPVEVDLHTKETIERKLSISTVKEVSSPQTILQDKSDHILIPATDISLTSKELTDEQKSSINKSQNNAHPVKDTMESPSDIEIPSKTSPTLDLTSKSSLPCLTINNEEEKIDTSIELAIADSIKTDTQLSTSESESHVSSKDISAITISDQEKLITSDMTHRDISNQITDSKMLLPQKSESKDLSPQNLDTSKDGESTCAKTTLPTLLDQESNSNQQYLPREINADKVDLKNELAQSDDSKKVIDPAHVTDETNIENYDTHSTSALTDKKLDAAESLPVDKESIAGDSNEISSICQQKTVISPIKDEDSIATDYEKVSQKTLEDTAMYSKLPDTSEDEIKTSLIKKPENELTVNTLTSTEDVEDSTATELSQSTDDSQLNQKVLRKDSLKSLSTSKQISSSEIVVSTSPLSKDTVDGEKSHRKSSITQFSPSKSEEFEIPVKNNDTMLDVDEKISKDIKTDSENLSESQRRFSLSKSTTEPILKDETVASIHKKTHSPEEKLPADVDEKFPSRHGSIQIDEILNEINETEQVLETLSSGSEDTKPQAPLHEELQIDQSKTSQLSKEKGEAEVQAPQSEKEKIIQEKDSQIEEILFEKSISKQQIPMELESESKSPLLSESAPIASKTQETKPEDKEISLGLPDEESSFKSTEQLPSIKSKDEIIQETQRKMSIPIDNISTTKSGKSTDSKEKSSEEEEKSIDNKIIPMSSDISPALIGQKESFTKDSDVETALKKADDIHGMTDGKDLISSVSDTAQTSDTKKIDPECYEKESPTTAPSPASNRGSISDNADLLKSSTITDTILQSSFNKNELESQGNRKESLKTDLDEFIKFQTNDIPLSKLNISTDSEKPLEGESLPESTKSATDMKEIIPETDSKLSLSESTYDMEAEESKRTLENIEVRDALKPEIPHISSTPTTKLPIDEKKDRKETIEKDSYEGNKAFDSTSEDEKELPTPSSLPVDLQKQLLHKVSIEEKSLPKEISFSKEEIRISETDAKLPLEKSKTDTQKEEKEQSPLGTIISSADSILNTLEVVSAEHKNEKPETTEYLYSPETARTNIFPEKAISSTVEPQLKKKVTETEKCDKLQESESNKLSAENRRSSESDEKLLKSATVSIDNNEVFSQPIHDTEINVTMTKITSNTEALPEKMDLTSEKSKLDEVSQVQKSDYQSRELQNLSQLADSEKEISPTKLRDEKNCFPDGSVSEKYTKEDFVPEIKDELDIHKLPEVKEKIKIEDGSKSTSPGASVSDDSTEELTKIEQLPISPDQKGQEKFLLKSEGIIEMKTITPSGSSSIDVLPQQSKIEDDSIRKIHESQNNDIVLEQIETISPDDSKISKEIVIEMKSHKKEQLSKEGTGSPGKSEDKKISDLPTSEEFLQEQVDIHDKLMEKIIKSQRNSIDTDKIDTTGSNIDLQVSKEALSKIKSEVTEPINKAELSKAEELQKGQSEIENNLKEEITISQIDDSKKTRSPTDQQIEKMPSEIKSETSEVSDMVKVEDIETSKLQITPEFSEEQNKKYGDSVEQISGPRKTSITDANKFDEIKMSKGDSEKSKLEEIETTDQKTTKEFTHEQPEIYGALIGKMVEPEEIHTSEQIEITSPTDSQVLEEVSSEVKYHENKYSDKVTSDKEESEGKEATYQQTIPEFIQEQSKLDDDLIEKVIKSQRSSICEKIETVAPVDSKIFEDALSKTKSLEKEHFEKDMNNTNVLEGKQIDLPTSKELPPKQTDIHDELIENMIKSCSSSINSDKIETISPIKTQILEQTSSEIQPHETEQYSLEKSQGEIISSQVEEKIEVQCKSSETMTKSQCASTNSDDDTIHPIDPKLIKEAHLEIKSHDNAYSDAVIKDAERTEKSNINDMQTAEEFIQEQTEIYDELVEKITRSQRSSIVMDETETISPTSTQIIKPSQLEIKLIEKEDINEVGNIIKSEDIEITDLQMAQDSFQEQSEICEDLIKKIIKPQRSSITPEKTDTIRLLNTQELKEAQPEVDETSISAKYSEKLEKTATSDLQTESPHKSSEIHEGSATDKIKTASSEVQSSKESPTGQNAGSDIAKEKSIKSNKEDITLSKPVDSPILKDSPTDDFLTRKKSFSDDKTYFQENKTAQLTGLQRNTLISIRPEGYSIDKSAEEITSELILENAAAIEALKDESFDEVPIQGYSTEEMASDDKDMASHTSEQISTETTSPDLSKLKEKSIELDKLTEQLGNQKKTSTEEISATPKQDISSNEQTLQSDKQQADYKDVTLSHSSPIQKKDTPIDTEKISKYEDATQSHTQEELVSKDAEFATGDTVGTGTITKVFDNQTAPDKDHKVQALKLKEDAGVPDETDGKKSSTSTIITITEKFPSKEMASAKQINLEHSVSQTATLDSTPTKTLETITSVEKVQTKEPENAIISREFLKEQAGADENMVEKSIEKGKIKPQEMTTEETKSETPDTQLQKKQDSEINEKSEENIIEMVRDFINQERIADSLFTEEKCKVESDQKLALHLKDPMDKTVMPMRKVSEDSDTQNRLTKGEDIKPTDIISMSFEFTKQSSPKEISPEKQLHEKQLDMTKSETSTKIDEIGHNLETQEKLEDTSKDFSKLPQSIHSSSPDKSKDSVQYAEEITSKRDSSQDTQMTTISQIETKETTFTTSEKNEASPQSTTTLIEKVCSSHTESEEKTDKIHSESSTTTKVTYSIDNDDSIPEEILKELEKIAPGKTESTYTTYQTEIDKSTSTETKSQEKVTKQFKDVTESPIKKLATHAEETVTNIASDAIRKLDDTADIKELIREVSDQTKSDNMETTEYYTEKYYKEPSGRRTSGGDESIKDQFCSTTYITTTSGAVTTGDKSYSTTVVISGGEAKGDKDVDSSIQTVTTITTSSPTVQTSTTHDRRGSQPSESVKTDKSGSPISPELQLDATQMRVKFTTDRKDDDDSKRYTLKCKSNSEEFFDSSSSTQDVVGDLSSKFEKREPVAKTVSLPILDEKFEDAKTSVDVEKNEDFSRSYPYLEKISNNEVRTPTNLSDPTLIKQVEGELQSKSVSMPVIKRPDDSERYMTLPHLYKSDNLEDLTSNAVIKTTVASIAHERRESEGGTTVETPREESTIIDPIKETEEPAEDTYTFVKTIRTFIIEDEPNEEETTTTTTTCSSDEVIKEKNKLTDHHEKVSSPKQDSALQKDISPEKLAQQSEIVDDKQSQESTKSPSTTDISQMSASMMQSFYGNYPDDDSGSDQETSQNQSETKGIESGRESSHSTKKDPIGDWGKPLRLPDERSMSTLLVWNPLEDWGKPLGLPSPTPTPVLNEQHRESNGDIEITLAPVNTKGTPKRTVKKPSEKSHTARDTSRNRDSSTKKTKLSKQVNPFYVDLAYVPHHGNPYYTTVEFFKRIRARYYVFSGTDPNKDVFNALLEGKKSWENQDLEVTIISTYDTDVLGYWITENEETLANLRIDLAPSASRCTINLQDHDTSCSAYRLEF